MLVSNGFQIVSVIVAREMLAFTTISQGAEVPIQRVATQTIREVRTKEAILCCIYRYRQLFGF